MPRDARPPADALDAVDRALVQALSQDGRRSCADLAKRLGLSRQAVTERLRDLERRGTIRGYQADVAPEALGLGVRAQLRLAIDGTAPHREADVVKRLTGSPFVRTVYRVSGEDCFVAEVICRHIDDVNELLLELKATRAIQSSRTAFVLETLLDRGTLGPVDPALIAEAGRVRRPVAARRAQGGAKRRGTAPDGDRP